MIKAGVKTYLAKGRAKLAARTTRSQEVVSRKRDRAKWRDGIRGLLIGSREMETAEGGDGEDGSGGGSADESAS